MLQCEGVEIKENFNSIDDLLMCTRRGALLQPYDGTGTTTKGARYLSRLRHLVDGYLPIDCFGAGHQGNWRVGEVTQFC